MWVMIANEVLAELEKCASPGDHEFLARFFKTGEGQYGAGDQFIGVRVPDTRVVARKFVHISLDEVEALLESPLHEMRLCAVIIMTMQAKRASDPALEELVNLYLRRTDCINNWDIVDTSCRDIIGEYALRHPDKLSLLRKLARSDDMWERRIAMVSTWQFIRKHQLDPTFEIAAMLLGDKQDLMHKAVGWMLREAGKRDADRLREFLLEHIHEVPRTALRYAIEHFDPEERAYFLKLR
jgi:3-methyladenine DNA glycosylase AlkD